MRTALRALPIALVSAALLLTACGKSRAAGTPPPGRTGLPATPTPTISGTATRTASASPVPGRSATPAASGATVVPSGRAADNAYFLAPLDKTVGLPQGFVPPGLTPVPRAYSYYSSGISIRSDVLSGLKGLVDAAQKGGVTLLVFSCYRSYDLQLAIWSSDVKQYGLAKTEQMDAPPGHSEHQLGTACDFTNAGTKNPVDQGWGETAAGRWMAAGAWKYGWALSYPRGEEASTGYEYEPWHFRYIGVDLARRWHDSGLTLVQLLRGLG